MILHGDSLERLKEFPDNYFDSVVTDPPYGLSFMGKKWDYDVPSIDLWREILRVLKPGAHVLSFGGTRTYHRLVVGIEDAGFDIRDQVQWIYGSGFPKSLDVSKAIDKAAGARGHDGKRFNAAGDGESNGGSKFRSDHPEYAKPEAITPAARTWSGWGTALKPANEPICLARKPLSEKTVAANVLRWGTGALNVDASRIGGESLTYRTTSYRDASTGEFSGQAQENYTTGEKTVQGRWPANVLFDESAAEMLDEQSGDRGISKGGSRGGKRNQAFGMGAQDIPLGFGDSGGASRFFYVAKASKRERNAGLEGMPVKRNDTHNNPSRMVGSSADKAKSEMDTSGTAGNQNHHPTVKPIKLMEYLCRLITPPAGIVLDPFAGSGSTGVAAKNLGFGFVGIEMSAEYAEIARKRLEASA